MIGFISGAGIVVRNSIILVDFIELRLKEGMPLDLAVIDAGAVRFRPMMLTAAAVVVSASVILFDPIFQGLAISLMAGEVGKGKIPADQLSKTFKTLAWGAAIWDVPEAVAALKTGKDTLWVDTRPESFFKKGTVANAVLLIYNKKDKEENNITI